MKKKLQVFISSTYKDLIDERQAAVEAILNAGHIPAGMELFSAGDESQSETVKRWIDESDVFLLILGGRYGSIEPNTRMGYVEVEYDYASKTKTPTFAVVMSEQWIDRKVKEFGQDVFEYSHREMYEKFKSRVLSKICRIADDTKDIKISIHETLQDFLGRYNFSGWVSGKEIPQTNKVLEQVAGLTKDNQMLRKELEKLKGQLREEEVQICGMPYPKMKALLEYTGVMPETEAETDCSLLHALFVAYPALAAGVDSSINSSPHDRYIFRYVAPPLLAFGLVERAKVPGAKYVRFHLSEAGCKFISLCTLEQQEEDAKAASQ